MEYSSICPRDPEHTAEAYLLGQLSPTETRAFEDHYLTCPLCAAVLEEAQRFVAGMKEAAERLEKKDEEGGEN